MVESKTFGKIIICFSRILFSSIHCLLNCFTVLWGLHLSYAGFVFKADLLCSFFFFFAPPLHDSQSKQALFIFNRVILQPINSMTCLKLSIPPSSLLPVFILLAGAQKQKQVGGASVLTTWYSHIRSFSFYWYPAEPRAALANTLTSLSEHLRKREKVDYAL